MRRDNVEPAHRGFVLENTLGAHGGSDGADAGKGGDPFPLGARHGYGLAHVESSSSLVETATIAEAGEGGNALPGGRAATWRQTPKARAILARLTADQVHLSAVTPAAGPRFYRWTAGAVSERLEAIRKEALRVQFGCDFNDACEQGRGAEFLELHARTPDLSDALADLLGDPAQFGPCPQSVRGSHDSNPAKANAHVERVLAGRAAA